MVSTTVITIGMELIGFFLLWFLIRVLSKPVGGATIGWRRSGAMALAITIVMFAVMYILGKMVSGIITIAI